MNEDDYADLVSHVSRTLEARGLYDVVGRSFDRPWDTEPTPRDQLLVLLSTLREYLALGDNYVGRRSLSDLRQNVETESGEPISGLVVDLTPEQARFVGSDSVDLVSGGSTVRQLVDDLEQLIAELGDDRTDDPQP
jgi:hypothetical protein